MDQIKKCHGELVEIYFDLQKQGLRLNIPVFTQKLSIILSNLADGINQAEVAVTEDKKSMEKSVDESWEKNR